MDEHEPIPYRPNQYVEKMRMIGDAAALLFDSYGDSKVNEEGKGICYVHWEDEELATEYYIARYEQSLDHEGLIEFGITEHLPNNERHRLVHTFNVITIDYTTRTFEMPVKLRKEYEEREKRAIERNGVLILPPQENELDPEYKLELHLHTLNKAFGILELNNGEA